MVPGEMQWIYLVDFMQEIAFGELWYRPDVNGKRPGC